MLRFPSRLYDLGLGWLLGERFLELTVSGRRTGLPRSVVLEVLEPFEEEGGRLGFVIASAWGTRAQWFRNAEAAGRAVVRVGRSSFSAEVRRLSEDEAAVKLRRYAVRHHLAYQLFIGPILLGRRPRGSAEEFSELARSTPILVVVALPQAA